MMANGNKDYARSHNNLLRGSDNNASKGDSEGEGHKGNHDSGYKDNSYKDVGNKSDNSSINDGKR